MTDNSSFSSTPAATFESTPVFNQVNPAWQIGNLLGEAWQLSSGFKATSWGALLIYLGISLLLSMVASWINSDSIMLGLLIQLASTLVITPLGAGLCMLGIKRSVGAETNAFMIFDYFPKMINLFLLSLLMGLLIVVGIILLVLPGIYLAVAYSLAIPLMVEKNMGIWEALETSRKTITRCWGRVFGLYILMMLIFLVAMIPFGLGLIWVLPWMYVTVGVLYRNLFPIRQDV